MDPCAALSVPLFCAERRIIIQTIDSVSEAPHRVGTSSASGTSGRMLDSWKEIAAYLKRDVRTVQRWETGEGMPVHRHTHMQRSSVYAYSGELDRWWASRGTVWASTPGRMAHLTLR